MTVSVHLDVLCESEEKAVWAMETLSRAAVGLAFDGVYATVAVLEVDDEDDEA